MQQRKTLLKCLLEIKSTRQVLKHMDVDLGSVCKSTMFICVYILYHIVMVSYVCCILNNDLMSLSYTQSGRDVERQEGMQFARRNSMLFIESR